MDSPHSRTLPQNTSVREMEQNISQPDNQTTQPGSEPAQIEVTGNAPCDNMSSLSTHRQLDKVGARMMDMGTNTSDREVRPQIDGVSNINIDANTQTSHLPIDVTLSISVNEQRPIHCINQSVYDPESLGGSHTRIKDMGMQEFIPQLDGPVSISSRTRQRLSENTRFEQRYLQEGIYLQGTFAMHRREYPGESWYDTHG